MREMTVVGSTGELRREVAAARGRGEKIGVVPTMGALHAGHLSLIEVARAECDYVVVTIFVNPTQFGPNEDFQQYPRSLDTDLDECRRACADLVCCPDTEEIFPEGCATFVEVEGLSSVLEGKFRPGHFRGVATVVLKLLNSTSPDVAYFGRKDYQQQILIRKMCADLQLPVMIRTCPTVREPDGLALSSRNRTLNDEQRQSALLLSQSLKLAKEQLLAGETNLDAVRQTMLTHLSSDSAVSVDYATIAHPESLEEITEPLPEMVALVAARVGPARLIDNLPIRLKRR